LYFDKLHEVKCQTSREIGAKFGMNKISNQTNHWVKYINHLQNRASSMDEKIQIKQTIGLSKLTTYKIAKLIG
jgi:hypothetical protein